MNLLKDLQSHGGADRADFLQARINGLDLKIQPPLAHARQTTMPAPLAAKKITALLNNVAKGVGVAITHKSGVQKLRSIHTLGQF